MSLVKNVGIGRDVVYNPFYHYVPDGDEWVRRLKKYDLMPKADWQNGIENIEYSYVLQKDQLCLFVDMEFYGNKCHFTVNFNIEEKSVCTDIGAVWYLEQLQKKYPRAFIGKSIYNYKWLYYIK